MNEESQDTQDERFVSCVILCLGHILFSPEDEPLAVAALGVWPASDLVVIKLFEVSEPHRGQRKGYVRILAQGIYDFAKAQIGAGVTLQVEDFSIEGRNRLKPVLQSLEFMPQNKGVHLFIPPEL